jgi:hypothetical protein
VQRAIELGEHDRVRLTIVSDLQRAGWGDEGAMAVPDRLQLQLRDAGAAATPNLAVVGVRREPNAVIATLRNSGTEAASGAARIVVDGRAVATASFTVAAGSSVERSIPYRAPDRAELAVEIDDTTGFQADNARYLIADRRGGTRLLVVGESAAESGFFLTRALDAAGSDDGFEVHASSGAAIDRGSASDWNDLGAVVLLSTRSVDRRARDMLASFVRAGGGLFVAAAPEVEASALAGIMGWSNFVASEQAANRVVLAPTDARHPIFKPFGALTANLGQVRFTRTWRVREEGWDVIARFSDASPALLERRDGEGRVVLFASDLDRRWNDFPLNPAFVPFVVEAIRHVAVAPDARRDYTVAHAPAGAKPQPGIYTLPSSQRRIAVNVEVRESETARMPEAEFSAMLRPAPDPAPPPVAHRAQQAEGRQSLWRYGLMLMIGVLVVESVVGRR